MPPQRGFVLSTRYTCRPALTPAGDVPACTPTRERILGLGYTVISNTPEEFAAQIRNEVEKWGKVIKSAGIKPE